MATVGNRFESLLINAKNPLEKSKKREKKRQEDKSGKSRGSKLSSPKKENAQPAEAPKKPETIKQTPVVITDLTESKQKKPVQIPQRKESNVIVKDVTEPKRFDKDTNGDGISFIHDPKSRPVNRYQKVMVDRGRIYDRHGPPRPDRQHEKRHGHGAFNWGEQLDNTVDSIDVNEAPVKAEASAQPKEESVQVTITLDQYKKLIQEKKIDPLTWSQEPPKSEKYVPETDDAKEYDYNRVYNVPRGRGGGRYAGRGSGPNRGRDAPQGNARTSAYQEKRGPVTVVDVKVDDRNDFPEL